MINNNNIVIVYEFSAISLSLDGFNKRFSLKYYYWYNHYYCYQRLSRRHVFPVSSQTNAQCSMGSVLRFGQQLAKDNRMYFQERLLEIFKYLFREIRTTIRAISKYYNRMIINRLKKKYIDKTIIVHRQIYIIKNAL